MKGTDDMASDKASPHLQPGHWPNHVGKFGTPPLRRCRSGGSLADFVCKEMSNGIAVPQLSVSMIEKGRDEYFSMPEEKYHEEFNSYRGIFIRYAEHTSLQAIPFINKANRWYTKFFWVMVLLGALAGTVVQLYDIYYKYSKMDTTTTVKIRYNTLDFPSITLCNMNPLRESKQSNFSKELLEFTEMLEPQENYTYNSLYAPPLGTGQSAGPGAAQPGGPAKIKQPAVKASGSNESEELPSLGFDKGVPILDDLKNAMDKIKEKIMKRKSSKTKKSDVRHQRYMKTGSSKQNPTMIKNKGQDKDGNNKDDSGQEEEEKWAPVEAHTNGEYGGGNITENVQARSVFNQLVSNQTYSERLTFGHQIEDMLVTCSFNGRECLPEEFTTSLTIDYGNCYTYNTAENFLTSGYVRSVPMKSHRSGVNYGLQMLLYIQEHEYLKGLTIGKGIRMAIHPFNTSAFVVENGISLSPGEEVFIGMKLVTMERLGAPYEPCNDGGDFEETFNRTYTIEGCINTCHDRQIADKCGCYRKEYPHHYNWQFVASNRSCDLEKDGDCIDDILEGVRNNHVDCNCRQACSSREYELEISNNYWPDNGIWFWLVDQVCAQDEHDCEKLRNHLEKYAEAFSADSGSDDQEAAMNLAKTLILERNFLVVNVYYRDLNYEMLVESADYGQEQFVADFGGVLGLWLGATFVTAMELLDLIFQICVRSAKGKSVDKKENAKPVNNNNCNNSKSNACSRGTLKDKRYNLGSDVTNPTYDT